MARDPPPRDLTVRSYLLFITEVLSLEGRFLPYMAARDPGGAVGGGFGVQV